MNYFVIIYSILLLLITYMGLKKSLGGSKRSLILNMFLVAISFFNLFYECYELRISLCVLLLLMPLSYIYDRKESGKKINYSHHIIRILIHVLIIYFLLT